MPGDAADPPRILIVEDDSEIAHPLLSDLELQGMRAVWAKDGISAVEMKAGFRPHVILLDLQLPDLNGMALIRRWGEASASGLIVISGGGDAAERVVALEQGADDYVTKPFVQRELVARLRALHRRVRSSEAGAALPSVLRIGSYTVDLTRHAVIDADGLPVELTGAEFAALRCLLQHPGEPVSRDSLSQVALRRRWQPEDRGVDQLICGIRQKLRNGENDNSPIQSIRGAGYLVRCSA